MATQTSARISSPEDDLGPVPAHVPQHLLFDFDIYRDQRLPTGDFQTYATLHDDAPDIFYTPRNGGHWVFTRYDDIFDAVRDPEIFSTREMEMPRLTNPPVYTPLSFDPPGNMPYRKAMMPFFTAKVVAMMEPSTRGYARDLVAEVADKGGCDFVHDISSRFPVSVFMKMLDMPMNRLREFRALTDTFFKARDEAEIEGVRNRIMEVMTELIVSRQANPGGDLISSLTQADIDGRPISLSELQSILMTLFIGGMDTVTNVTSYAYRHLAGDPELQAKLAADPALIPKFVDEVLRLFAAVNISRIVARDAERFGVAFKRNDMVFMALALAGRDERKASDPNQFRLDRERREHLAFSAGAHLCLGHYLARAELRILTEEWLRRIPAFRPAPRQTSTSRVGIVLALEKLHLEW